MEERIPVTILAGFLGSGKTTLLNHLLRGDHGRRIAVVVNEFGEVGIDGARVSGAQQFVELDNGCLCCSINDDLQECLVNLAKRGGFAQVVLETTGLADPLPVGWTLSRERLVDHYRLDALVTVVDAMNLEQALRLAPEAEIQIARADLLVLNKLDLVDDGGAAARQTLAQYNSRAEVVPAIQGQVSLEVLLSDSRPEFARAGGVDRIPEDPVPWASHDTHSVSFETWTFRPDSLLSDEALEDFLYENPEGVYRIKGIVQTDGAAEWTFFSAVAGRFEMTEHHGVPKAGGAMVFIGRRLDRRSLQDRCEALLLDE